MMPQDTPPGTPFGIEGHRPNVPLAAGVPPWCECGYRWNGRPGSPLVGEHIRAEESKLAQPVRAAGWLR